MKKFLKITLGIFGVILLGIALLVFDFLSDMKPDKEREEEVKVQAEQYLRDNFEGGHFEIYDIWYDNMDVNNLFEYAAKVRSEDTIEFLVYFNNERNKMEDSYVAEKWAKNLYDNLHPYLEKNIGDMEELFVLFDDDVGSIYNLDYKNPGEFRDYEAPATIHITLSRNLKDSDEKFLDGVTIYLQNELQVRHAIVQLNSSKNYQLNPLISQF
ncbi:hypothetical protein [Bacillus marasmi]|uniref:hypothetical protein n=1 Tax=Bacillus marasmi TaxID=1926279 RepID=UPI0011C715CA|nr:hypothetical protein [Bacillus marasmi]